MEQTKRLDDAIAEANGSRTISDQFRDIRVSVTKAWNAITGIDTRVTVTDADIMDLRAEIEAMKKEKSNESS